MTFDGTIIRLDVAAIRQLQNHRLAVNVEIVLKTDIVRQAAFDWAARLETAMRYRNVFMVIRFLFCWKDLRRDTNARLRCRERCVADRHVPHATGFEPESTVACQ